MKLASQHGISKSVLHESASSLPRRDGGDNRSILAGDISVSSTGKILLYNCSVFDSCRNHALPNVTAHREGCELSVYVQVPFVGRIAETASTKGAQTGNDIVFVKFPLRPTNFTLPSSMFHTSMYKCHHSFTVYVSPVQAVQSKGLSQA